MTSYSVSQTRVLDNPTSRRTTHEATMVPLLGLKLYIYIFDIEVNKNMFSRTLSGIISPALIYPVIATCEPVSKQFQA